MAIENADLKFLDWAFKGILFLVGSIQTVYFFIIKGVRADVNKAHDRITSESERNNEKFARRDDVAAMEGRIVDAIGALSDKIDRVIEKK